MPPLKPAATPPGERPPCEDGAGTGTSWEVDGIAPSRRCGAGPLPCSDDAWRLRTEAARRPVASTKEVDGASGAPSAKSAAETAGCILVAASPPPRINRVVSSRSTSNCGPRDRIPAPSVALRWASTRFRCSSRAASGRAAGSVGGNDLTAANKLPSSRPSGVRMACRFPAVASRSASSVSPASRRRTRDGAVSCEKPPDMFGPSAKLTEPDKFATGGVATGMVATCGVAVGPAGGAGAGAAAWGGVACDCDATSGVAAGCVATDSVATGCVATDFVATGLVAPSSVAPGVEAVRGR
jgi:hypothetical protein